VILWSVLDWFCAYCTGESCFEVKTEADSNDVTQHLHPDEYSCLCNQCGRCFSSSDDLYRHMNIHVSKFVCTDCGECYGNNSKLAVHRRSHSGEKPFECTVCSKRFTASHHLVAHSRIHSGEKPYKCYVCDKAFTESGHLKRHMRVHTGYKPYQCSVCDKSFSDSRSLQRHLSWLYFVQTVLEWISSWNSYVSDMTNWLIFGWPFVKRFALCYRTVIKMKLGTEVGLRPGDIVLDGDAASTSPLKKGAQPPPIFGPSIVAKRSPISCTAELLFNLVPSSLRVFKNCWSLVTASCV